MKNAISRIFIVTYSQPVLEQHLHPVIGRGERVACPVLVIRILHGHAARSCPVAIRKDIPDSW
ncbi:hypothetical protein SXCC_01663 [Gluconacetobacter sp. SXCC-1]|nr:hypothetical protein SXCC_01663 [Gluconacetobacter sp. SXCC-1]